MIDLPASPAPNDASAALIDYGFFLGGPLGGPTQRIDRMGNRFRLSLSYPPMLSRTDGRRFVSRLIRGKTEGVRLEFPLLDFDPGLPGSPTVDGSGQTGRTLAIKGAQPNYIFREGQFISVKTGGRHHLINIDAEAIVASDGTVTLSVSPMLRVAHLDDDEVHVAQPMFEGFIHGDEQVWSMSIDHLIGVGFDVVEAA